MAKLSRKRLAARAKRAVRHMAPTHLIRSQLTASVFKNFADSIGLVYFGTLHRNDEDFRLVRGHTVSRTHIDNHYSVGSIRGYDIAMVLRNDVVFVGGDHHEQRCHWLILTIDLKTKVDIPHLYVGHRNRDGAFKAAFERIAPIFIGTTGHYPTRFLSEYTVYGYPGHALEIERAITPQMADVIANHFEEASVEIEDNTVYMYIESRRPSTAQLEKLLSNGLWLAECIDVAAGATSVSAHH